MISALNVHRSCLWDKQGEPKKNAGSVAAFLFDWVTCPIHGRSMLGNEDSLYQMLSRSALRVLSVR